MSETKFVLGPKQREWIKSLREHLPLVKWRIPMGFVGWEEIGLDTERGFLKRPYFFTGPPVIHSLLMFLQNGSSFREIADYVEANPENVFTKSV